MTQEELEVVASQAMSLRQIPLQAGLHYCTGFEDGFNLAQKIQRNQELHCVATQMGGRDMIQYKKEHKTKQIEDDIH